MNEKGQMVGIGTVIIVFVTLLVGIILFQAIAQQAGDSINLATKDNETTTLAADGSSIYITDAKYLSDVIITNSTDGSVVPSSNYTVTNNVVYNGALAVEITTVAESFYASEEVNLSATVQPLTYIPESGSRSIVTLIAIFFALALVVVTLVPTLGNDFMRSMTGR